MEVLGKRMLASRTQGNCTRRSEYQQPTRMGIGYKKHDGRFADLAASPVPSRVGC